MSEGKGSSATPSRRGFLGSMTAAMAAGVASVMGIAAGRFALFPAFRRTMEQEHWETVGAVDEIPWGEPTKRSVVISQDAGWGKFNSQRLVWVVRRGQDIKVFSATCPHLGCTVNAAPQGFVCPCHGSAWGPDGQRLGGPTMRGLDTLDTRVQQGALQVKYEFFKQGIADKVIIS